MDVTAGSGEALRQQLADRLTAKKLARLTAHSAKFGEEPEEFQASMGKSLKRGAREEVDAIWPLVEAALAAARVATATAEQQRIWELLTDHCNIAGQVWLLHDLVKQAFPDAIAALGGSVPAPKGDQ